MFAFLSPVRDLLTSLPFSGVRLNFLAPLSSVYSSLCTLASCPPGFTDDILANPLVAYPLQAALILWLIAFGPLILFAVLVPIATLVVALLSVVLTLVLEFCPWLVRFVVAGMLLLLQAYEGSVGCTWNMPKRLA